mmetsp:Transcript_18321/g.25746  ORF Transcript_18321/g.25746 Transcript_18321/m.25746 type:complete len:85 (+) Transcript_18321:370-624(+)
MYTFLHYWLLVQKLTHFFPSHPPHKNANGKVSFEEFVAGIAAIGSDSADPQNRLNFVFQSCDLSGDGVVEKDELRSSCSILRIS